MSSDSSDAFRLKLLEQVRRQKDASSRGAAEEGGEEGIPPALQSAGGFTSQDVELEFAELLLAQPRSLDELKALEAVVDPTHPALLVIDDDFKSAGPKFPELAQELNRERLREVVRAVGRLDFVGPSSLPYAGTGFIVGPDLVMTNRHVASLFASGVGKRDRLTYPLDKQGVVLDLKQENQPGSSLRLKVTGVELIHPHWDMALLRVEGIPKGHPVLELASEAPDASRPVEVVTIGYPARDSRNGLEHVTQVFGSIFERKRLAPGFLTGTRLVESQGHAVEAQTHSCNTLGGNSGSCVVEVTTGRVVGLHFGGIYLDTNFAVPSWELARDSRVIGAGVRFEPKPELSIPPWESAWARLEAPARGSGPNLGRPALSAVEWFERLDEDQLRLEWDADRDATRERLLQSVGPDETREITRRIETMGEGLFSRRRVDPELPEILYLHGIMGGHLRTEEGRLWLHLARMVIWPVATRLTLQTDGLTDAFTGQSTRADGHLKMKYHRAAEAWRDQGFRVHEFSFDWRKSVEQSADRLNLFVESLMLDSPSKRPFLLVAHSMGGLVASMYAQRHNGWKERIHRAVFLGSPLGGSYAPFEAVTGTYPFFRKLSLVLNVTESDPMGALQRAARSLPGLIDMLPDPELFPDAAPLYTESNWPTRFPPAQRWLDQSLALKKPLRESPLLERATLLVSLNHGTVSGVTQVGGHLRATARNEVGDGTVPARAAALVGLPAYAVTYEHSDLARDPQVIQTVVRLAREGTAPLLPRVAEAQVRGPLVSQEEAVALVAVEAKDDELQAQEFRRRALTGELEGRDIDWLMSSGLSEDTREVPRGSEARGITARALQVANAPDPEADELLPLGGVPISTHDEYQLQGPFNVGDPVHETLTLMALKATLSKDARSFKDVPDYIRGVFWNDDPEGNLFDASDDPLDFSSGIVFGTRFKVYGWKAKKEFQGNGSALLARSHYGDMQFLHAMASTDEKSREETLQGMLEWAEFCWGVARGDIPEGQLLGDQPVNPVRELLRDFSQKPVSWLFHVRTGTSADMATRQRALGSLLHMVQDSFAGGHVERETSLVDSNRKGRIVRFHCYVNQDHGEHSHFDQWQGGDRDDEKVDRLPGARDALIQSTALLKLMAQKADWQTVRRALLEGPFALSEAQPQAGFG